MLTVLRSRLNKDEEDGFTLIELMVVVLIIAILIAIAIPTFLGAQDRARDRGAQSDLRNGLTAAKTIATDDEGSFAGVTQDTLTDTEGSLTFANNTTPANGTVSWTVTTGDELLLQTESGSGSVFAVCANSEGATTYANAAVTTFAGCTETEW